MALKTLKQINIAKIDHDIEQIKYLKNDILDKPLLENLAILKNILTENNKTLIKINDAITMLLGKKYLEPNPRQIPKKKRKFTLNQTEIKITEKKFKNGRLAAVIVDNVFTEETLNELRTFCVESSFWNDVKPNQNYLLTEKCHGFKSPLLGQIDFEIRQLLHKYLKRMKLVDYWAIKYNLIESGIPIHVDGAFEAFTCNFWITPTESNLKNNSGGMTIYNLQPPKSWKWPAAVADVPLINNYVRAKKPELLKIAYRTNRLVLFNSRNFHKTNAINFGPSFADRRISVTYIYQQPGTPITKYR